MQADRLLYGITLLPLMHPHSLYDKDIMKKLATASLQRALLLSWMGLLALFLSSCQSIRAYEDFCQSDEDCASHQQCDIDSGSCLLRATFARECDPEASLDTCPVATSCDEEARVCLPRKMRFAWFFAFESRRYERRQYSNLIKYLTDAVSRNYFSPISCRDASEQERQAHITYLCENELLEFIFVDTADESDVSVLVEQLREAYRHAPFDVILPVFSSYYAAAVDFTQSHDLDLLTFGRVNKRADRVEAELVPDYTYPALNSRYDFSLSPFESRPEIAHLFSRELGCKRPTMIHEDNEPYKLARIFFQNEWDTYGICLQHIVTSQEETSDNQAFLQAIEDLDADCLYMYEFNATRLTSFFRAYRNSALFESRPLTWFLRSREFVESNEASLQLRKIVQEDFWNDVIVYKSSPIDNPYQLLKSRLQPDYTTVLEAEQCLGAPRSSCDDLNCSNLDTLDALTIEACEQLGCPTPRPSLLCLELGCLNSTDTPEFCQRLQCSGTVSSCDYLAPSIFDSEPDLVSVFADQVIVSWLLAHEHQNISWAKRPIERSRLRDIFLSMTDETHPLCKIPDTLSCIRFIEQGQSYHYRGLNQEFVFGPDARAQQFENDLDVYQLNSNLEFLPAFDYKHSQRKMLVNELRASSPGNQCQAPGSVE